MIQSPNDGGNTWNDTDPPVVTNENNDTGWNDDDQPTPNNNNNNGGTSTWNDEDNQGGHPTGDHQTGSDWNDDNQGGTTTGSSWNDVYDQGNTAYQGGSWNDAVGHYDNIYSNQGYSSWNDEKKKEFFANAGSSYLFYGIELYNGRRHTSSWNNRYKEALKYLEKAYFELLRAADRDWRKDYRGVWREWGSLGFLFNIVENLWWFPAAGPQRPWLVRSLGWRRTYGS
jgi:hypothetical protein